MQYGGGMARGSANHLPLHPHERVLRGYNASFVAPAIAYLAGAAIVLAVFILATHILVLAGVVAILLAGLMHAVIRSQYVWVLTNHRLIEKRGILTRYTTTISHDRITDTHATRPLLAHLLGTGEVHVSTAGSDGTQITIFAQHEPTTLEHAVLDMRRSYLDQHGHGAQDQGRESV